MAVKLSTIFKMELSLFSAYYTHPEIPVGPSSLERRIGGLESVFLQEGD